jgi:hypothetical protein
MKRVFVVLALVVMTSAGFAQTPASSTPPPTLDLQATTIREITVGTVVPSGQNFGFRLNERNMEWAYAEWARSLPGAWKTVATREQFRSLVRDVVSRKLAAAFPAGPSPDAAASNMLIEIKVTLGKTPEIGITMGC